MTRKISRIYIFLEYPTDIPHISHIYPIYIPHLGTSHRYTISRDIPYRGTSHRYTISRDIPAKAWQKEYPRDIPCQPEGWQRKNSIYRPIPRVGWEAHNPYQPISFRPLILRRIKRSNLSISSIIIVNSLIILLIMIRALTSFKETSSLL